jgi:hypothetical protein
MIIITKPLNALPSFQTKASLLHHHTSQLIDSKNSFLCHCQTFKHTYEIQNVAIPFYVHQM